MSLDMLDVIPFHKTPLLGPCCFISQLFFFLVFDGLEKKKKGYWWCEMFSWYAPFHFYNLFAVVCRHWISRQLRSTPCRNGGYYAWWTPDILSYNGSRTLQNFIWH